MNYVKLGWDNIKLELNSINEFYSLSETVSRLKHENFYKSLFGKAKNRTLIKSDPILYKSIYTWTSILELTFKSQKSYKGNFNFKYRILFLVEKNADVQKLLCKCGKRYTWNTYCRYCPEYHVTCKSHSTETKKKQRIAAINYISNCSGKCVPRYNRSAIKLIESYGRDNGYNFRHAENGGEVFLSSLGYWLDAYDEEKNVVLEIDEPRHFKNGKLKNKDLQRQVEIENFLGCKFVRIKYD